MSRAAPVNEERRCVGDAPYAAASYGVPNAAVVDRVVAVNQDVAEGDDLRVIGNLFE